jgi:hypothetical protein
MRITSQPSYRHGRLNLPIYNRTVKSEELTRSLLSARIVNLSTRSVQTKPSNDDDGETTHSFHHALDALFQGGEEVGNFRHTHTLDNRRNTWSLDRVGWRISIKHLSNV